MQSMGCSSPKGLRLPTHGKDGRKRLEELRIEGDAICPRFPMPGWCVERTRPAKRMRRCACTTRHLVQRTVDKRDSLSNMLKDTIWKQCAVLGAAWLLNSPFALANEGGAPDPACDALNKAYQNSRTTPYYSASSYYVEPGGTRKPIFEIRVQTMNAFQRSQNDLEWKSVARPLSSVVTASGPKITSCRLLGDHTLSVGDTTHYSFDWHGAGTSASGQAWIENKTRRIAYLLRRFPPQADGSPQNILETFDYDPVRAMTVSPIEGSAAPTSPLSQSPPKRIRPVSTSIGRMFSPEALAHTPRTGSRGKERDFEAAQRISRDLHGRGLETRDFRQMDRRGSPAARDH